MFILQNTVTVFWVYRWLDSFSLFFFHSYYIGTSLVALTYIYINKIFCLAQPHICQSSFQVQTGQSVQTSQIALFCLLGKWSMIMQVKKRLCLYIMLRTSADDQDPQVICEGSHVVPVLPHLLYNCGNSADGPFGGGLAFGTMCKKQLTCQQTTRYFSS